MSQVLLSSALRLWRMLSSAAVLLVSLAFVFWQVDALLGYPVLRTTREEYHFFITILFLFPLVLSIWLKLRFFTPRQSSNADHQILGWLLLNGAVSFLIGVLFSFRFLMEPYGWITCIGIGVFLAFVNVLVGGIAGGLVMCILGLYRRK